MWISLDGQTGSNNEFRESHGIHTGYIWYSLIVFPCVCFIKLCNQVRGKQINGDNKSSGEK